MRVAFSTIQRKILGTTFIHVFMFMFMSYKFLIITNTVMASESRQLHIFFFPIMARGHLIPTVDSAKLFAARGVKATFVTTPRPFILQNP